VANGYHASTFSAKASHCARLCRLIATRSACESKHDQERAVEIVTRLRIEATDDAPDTIAAQRQQFIGHDLGSDTQPVSGIGVYQWPDWEMFCHIRCYRTYQYSRGYIAQRIGLDDDAWTRLSQFTRNDDQNDVAAFHE
jgi:hypothetical protein